jgi:hypothetical protein
MYKDVCTIYLHMHTNVSNNFAESTVHCTLYSNKSSLSVHLLLLLGKGSFRTWIVRSGDTLFTPLPPHHLPLSFPPPPLLLLPFLFPPPLTGTPLSLIPLPAVVAWPSFISSVPLVPPLSGPYSPRPPPPFSLYPLSVSPSFRSTISLVHSRPFLFLVHPPSKSPTLSFTFSLIHPLSDSPSPSFRLPI